MDLSKLEKSEAVAARVYLRNRRKAWDHFFSLQDLKTGDYVSCKKAIYQVVAVREDYDASPLDIVVTGRDVNTDRLALFGFSIKAQEAGLMYALLRLHNKDKNVLDVNTIYDPYELGLKLDEKAKLIYEKT